MARMFNPPHPAAILREDVLPALGLTVTVTECRNPVLESAPSGAQCILC